MTQAKAPTRGDKVTIELGLVTAPVILMNAVDDTVARIDRHYRHDGNEVGFSTYDKVTGEQIAKSDTYMAYITDDGTEVELSDEEIAAAMGFDAENPKAQTLGVFPISEADKYLVAGNYQVRPQTLTVGKNKTRPWDKVFTLIMTALSEAGAFILVTYVSRGKSKFVGIFPDGTARLFHWSNEVRETAKAVEVDTLSEQELAMAVKLVQALMSDDAPLLENEPVEKVRAYANAKAAGEAPKAKEPVTAPVDDLSALLAASIERGLAKV